MRKKLSLMILAILMLFVITACDEGVQNVCEISYSYMNAEKTENTEKTIDKPAKIMYNKKRNYLLSGF